MANPLEGTIAGTLIGKAIPTLATAALGPAGPIVGGVVADILGFKSVGAMETAATKDPASFRTKLETNRDIIVSDNRTAEAISVAKEHTKQIALQQKGWFKLFIIEGWRPIFALASVYIVVLFATLGAWAVYTDHDLNIEEYNAVLNFLDRPLELMIYGVIAYALGRSGEKITKIWKDK